MTDLVAGQNSELGSHELTFSVDPAQVAVVALAIDDQRHALPDGYIASPHSSPHPGIVAHPDRLAIDLDAVRADVARVLCVALHPQPGTAALACTLTDSHGQRTSFTVPAADVHAALISFELYRRGPRWKVRAVGQGYAGGAPDLARAHGIPITDTPAAPIHIQGTAAPTTGPISPLGNQDPLERISMIHEDAARSTAALLTARSFADTRRENEMTAAVADPATRNTAAGQHAMAEAQRRHDELIAAASADYHRDATHLIAELDALDGQLPSSLASWASPAWQHRPHPATGIRLGVLTVPDAGPLAVPLCLQAPIPRPLWIDTREPAAATPVLASVLTRLLAAMPHTATAVDVIDLAGGLGPLTSHLYAHMPRPTVSVHTDVVERLQLLVTQAELAALHGDSSDNATSDAGIVVIADPGYGLPPEAIQAIAQLINNSVPGRISILFAGDYADAATSMPLLREIAEYSHHIRTDGDDSAMLDPWTGNAWRFVPDTLAPGPRLADLIDAITPPNSDPGDESF